VTDEVFVGRTDELRRFAALLGGLPARRRWPRWPRSPRSGEDLAGAAKSYVVLVYGLGGRGKSRLLRRFREMADGGLPDSPVSPGRVRSVWLDWEDAQRDQPSSYAGFDGPSLVTVLDALQRAVIEAVRADAGAATQAGEVFAGYRQGAARMPQYAARFAEVIAQSRQAGSPVTSEDAASLARTGASIGLAAVGHPGGFAGLTPGQIGGTVQALGHVSEAAVRAVTGKKPGEISAEEYALVTDPEGELTRRAAAAVRGLAGRMPLVVLLDTGEIVGARAWAWLRRVMNQTGPRVIWVVGARFESEADAGGDSPVAQFGREIGDEHLLRMSPGRFDDRMISEFLAGRRSGRSYTGRQIDVIYRFTKGVPLAVSLAAALLDGGVPVEKVCEESGGGYPGGVVSALARRYLVHAEQQAYPSGDPRAGDVQKILGLALTVGDLSKDPGLLAALWDVRDPMAAFADLARRHDFVLPLSRRLHDDVRDTLRADLLDPWRRPGVRAVSQRALDLYRARLAEMRVSRPALDDQLADDGFMAAVLAALWHTAWVADQGGLELFIQILPVLAAAGPDTAQAAADVFGFFADTLGDGQRRHLDLLTQIRPAYPDGLRSGRERAARRTRRVQVTMPGLALLLPAPAAADPVIGDPADRQVAVMILQAQLWAGNGGDERAITSLRSAKTRTSSARLRLAIGTQATAIASRLIFAGPGNTAVPSAAGLAAAKIATETLTEITSAWNSYGAALSMASRHGDALAAFDQAITLDPGFAAAYNGRGNVLYALGRFGDALAAYDQAITLDPGSAIAHNGRGNALQALGRFGDALAAYDQAITLDHGDATAYNGRGNALRALGRFGDALAACDQAITLDPGDATAHNGRGNALRALGRFGDALAAYDQAITLDPGDAIAHNGRGNTLQALGRLEDALAAYDQAITLDPGDAIPQANKGITLAMMGGLDEALAELDTAGHLAPDVAGEGTTWAGAIMWHQRDAAGAQDQFASVAGRVTGCTPFRTAEMEAVALCGLGHAESAEQHLLAALPSWTPGDRADPRTIYDLLSDPPLPGIERLRAISERRP
jgi:tetratricopeptide (TPR) repeat protein